MNKTLNICDMVKNMYDNYDGEVNSMTKDEFDDLTDDYHLCEIQHIVAAYNDNDLYLILSTDDDEKFIYKKLSKEDVLKYIPDFEKFKNTLHAYDDLYMMECEEAANTSIDLEKYIYGSYNCYSIGDYKVYIFNRYVYVFRNDLYLFSYNSEEIEYESTGWMGHSWESFVERIQNGSEYCESGNILRNDNNKDYDYQFLYNNKYDELNHDINNAPVHDKLDELFDKYPGKDVEGKDIDQSNLNWYHLNEYSVFYDLEDINPITNLYVAKFTSWYDKNEDTLIKIKSFALDDLEGYFDLDGYLLFEQLIAYKSLYSDVELTPPLKDEEILKSLEDLSNKTHYVVANITMVCIENNIYFIYIEPSGDKVITYTDRFYEGKDIFEPLEDRLKKYGSDKFYIAE